MGFHLKVRFLKQWLNPICVFPLFAISGLEAGLGMRLGGGPGLPRGPGLPILGGKVLKKWARTPLFHTTGSTQMVLQIRVQASQKLMKFVKVKLLF